MAHWRLVEIYRGVRIERREPYSIRRGARNWRCDVPGTPTNTPSRAWRFSLAGCRTFVDRRLAALQRVDRVG